MYYKILNKIRNIHLFNEEKMSERNKRKYYKLKEIESNNRKKDAKKFRKIFSKKRLNTYFLLLIFSPYGLYKVWIKDSSFNEVEKYLWTFIFIVFLIKFINIII